MMKMLTWLKGKRGSFQSRRRALDERAKRRLTLQTLESRQLMAADSIGVVSPSGLWQLDSNRDGTVEMDRNYGLPGDRFVSGNWTGSGDQLGVTRPRPDGFLQWYLNTDAAGTPVHEVDFLFGLATDVPVVGNWNGDNVDNVGVVRRNIHGGLDWYMDLNRDPNPERVQTFGLHGDIPVVGDWDNNGTSNVGIVRPTATGHLEWFLDTTGDAWPEVRRIFGLVGDIPVVGDWNGDGRVDIGVARPVNVNGTTVYQWHLDTNGDVWADLPVVTLGRSGDTPVSGNWKFSEVSVYADYGNKGQILNGQAGAQKINFGVGIIGDEITRSFTVRNTGTAPLAISNVSIPEGFTLTDPIEPSIPAGQSDVFTIRMDTSRAASVGGFFQFSTNDGNELTYRFEVGGRVEAPAPQIQIDGNGAFGEIVINTVGTTRERNIKIMNTGNAPLTYTATRTGNTNFRVISGASGTIAKGSFATVRIRLLTTTLGDKTGNLVIESNSVAGAVTNIPLSGKIVPANPLASVAGNGDFGTVLQNSMGSGNERTFTITNHGNAPLNFTATSNSTTFVVDSGRSGTIAAKTTAVVKVRVLTTSLGAKSGTLTISSNATDNPTLRVDLHANVVQGLPKIEVTGNGAFGSVANGADVQRQFQIRNTGNTPLTYSTGINNAQFQVISGGSGTVAANNGVATIVVKIISTTGGNKNATLTIASNDPNRPVTTVTLSGTVAYEALPPEISVTVNNKELAPGQAGGIFYGASSAGVRTAEFRITNTGDGPLVIRNPQISGVYSHDMGTGFTLNNKGDTRVVKVRMKTQSVGTFRSQLIFNTNDADEGTITINLLGRYVPPATTVPGSANRSQTYRIHHNTSSTIYIDPPSGPVAFGTQRVISIGTNRSVHTAELRTVIIVSPTLPKVENWATGLAVRWQRPDGRLITILPMSQTV